MKNILVSLLVFIGGLGCSKSDDTNVVQPKPTGTVSGRVTIVGTSNPLAGVQVQCGGILYTTAADGNYELRNVTQGNQTLTASKTDFEPFARTITVTASSVENISMTSSIATGNLSGVVTNAVNGPLTGVAVSVHGLTDFTDATGHYQIPNIPQGIDTITCTHPRYLTAKFPLLLYSANKVFNMVLLRQDTLYTFMLADGDVYNLHPDSNFSTSDRLRLYNRTTGIYPYQETRVYIAPDVPAVLTDPRYSFVGGSIDLYANDAQFWQGNRLEGSTYLTGGWAEQSLTWNNQPATGPRLSGYLFWLPTPVNVYKQLLDSAAMTLFVDAWRVNPNVTIMLDVSLAACCASINFNSRESSSNWPRCTFIVRY